MTNGVRALALAVAAAFTACDPPTGVHIELAFDEELTIDTLEISGTVEGAEAIAPASLPAEPRALEPRGETFALYVDDTFAGGRLIIELVGLHDGVPVADTTARATLVEGELASMRIALSGSNG